MSYEESLKDYRDMYSVMKTQLERGIAIGEERGVERGIAIGEERGIERKNIKDIARMRSMDLSDEQIAQLLGLDTEYVKQH